MNPGNYSLKEMQKTIVSLVVLGAAVIGLIATEPDPNLTQICVTLIGSVFAVVGVFAAKNHTPDDLQKALEQFKGAALSVVGYFTVVPTGTGEKVGALIGIVVAVAAIYWTPNKKPGEAAPAGAAPGG
jgi:hypothetical protein